MTMIFVIFFGLAAVCLYFGIVKPLLRVNQSGKNYHAMDDAVKQTGVEFSKKYQSAESRNFIGIDESQGRLCVGDIDAANRINFIPYRDILESYIVEDGETVTKTSRSSQLGGALIGGVLAGGVGAIIGGLSGSSTARDKVKKIELCVVINEIENPIRKITFMDKYYDVEKRSSAYKTAHGNAENWHRMISVLIRRADEQDRKQTNSASAADELEKFAGLLERGILSAEEFNEKKRQLLG